MKMYKYYRWGLAMLVALVFCSCEKVIDLDLNEGEKKVVIDAELTDVAGGCVVKISQTKSFDDDNSFVGLSGAEVKILQGGQVLGTLTEVSPGVYKDAVLTGAYGQSYTLNVSLNGQVYTGSSTMPHLVPFDSLYVETKSFFGDDHTFATVVLHDPVDTQNNYRCIQYINDKRTKGNFILDDDYSDGKLFESTLYFDQDNNGDSIKSGDIVRVELQGIDRPVYQYWYSFEQSASGGQGSAAPANPVSNLSGGALGCFSVHTTQSREITVP